MPMTYLIFLATGSCFFSAHVGSELGRGLGLSGTAAEVIAARSRCNVEARWPSDPLAFKHGSWLQSSAPWQGSSSCLVRQSQLKVGRKSCEIPRGRGACRAGRRKPFKPLALSGFEEQPHPALDTLDTGFPSRPSGSPRGASRSCCGKSPELHLQPRCHKAPPKLFDSLSGGPLVFLFILTSLLYPLFTQTDVLQIT